MTFKETQKMLNLLRAMGVNSFKSGDLEVSFGGVGIAPVPLADVPKILRQSKSKTPAHGGAIPPVASDIPHHLNEVKSLLSMPDEEFIKKMFPDPSDEQPGVE